ncbi:MAG: hypothetical protein ACOVO1_02530 [Chitinophagaceae bacterium]
MDFTVYIFVVSMIVFIGASLYVWFRFFKKETKREIANDEAKKTMLQAYERLSLLVSRIGLPNLISRLNVPNSECRDMAQLLITTIREEFDFNTSQQIYVSANAWQAMKTLRDQNIAIVSQIAAAMPLEATGGDLNRAILEFLSDDKRGNLHELVSNVLAEEAKKLLNSSHVIYKD